MSQSVISYLINLVNKKVRKGPQQVPRAQADIFKLFVLSNSPKPYSVYCQVRQRKAANLYIWESETWGIVAIFAWKMADTINQIIKTIADQFSNDQQID